MKNLLSQLNKYLPLIGLIVIVVSFIVFQYAAGQKGDIRKKAAVVRGKAKLVASPEHETQFDKDSTVEMSIAVSLQNIAVDGFQVVATIKGNRTKDLRFDAAQAPDGMRVMVSRLSSAVATTSSELLLSYITEDPSVPYVGEGLVPLGTLRMTAPGDGKIDVFFDKAASKVTVHGTAEDILEIDRSQYTYTFITPPPPITCDLNIPTVTASPSAQIANAGKPLAYEIIIKNNNVGTGCRDETFNILPTVPQGWQTTHPADVTLANGATGTTTLTVTSAAGSAAQDYPVIVKARSLTFSGQQGEGRATYTVTPVKPLKLIFKIKLNGVTDNKADGFKANIRFVKGNLDSAMDLVFRHVGDGVYQALATITDPPAAGPGYQMIVKPEKHAARKFCKTAGQTASCRSFDSLSLPEGSDAITTLDFTGLLLDPGDLPPQDGRVDRGDIQKLRELMRKSCADLTGEDKLVADLNYDGCVDVGDAMLLRKTLEARYDEN